MTPYIRRGRKIFEMRVPLRNGGDGPIRTCGTEDKEIADEIQALVKRLRKKREYWPLLEAITANPPRLSLIQLYDADKANRLDDLLDRLDDPDLTEWLDGWESWVEANVGKTGTPAMYRSQVSTLFEPKGEDSPPFLLTDLTVARVSAWLASRDVSTEYRRHLLYAVFSFIRYLIEQDVLDHNPIEGIKRPKKGKPRVRWETAANDVRIVDAAPATYRSLFAFIKATGAEVSAALAMKGRDLPALWDEDDLRYCGLAHVPGTKEATRNRHDVLIEKWARPYLEGLRTHPNGLLWPDVPTRHAAHYHHQATCELLEIEDYTLRDSRHSWAVRGRKARPQVTFEDIAEQLGNTVAVVATRYAIYKMDPEERLASTKTATKTLRIKRGGKR